MKRKAAVSLLVLICLSFFCAFGVNAEQIDGYDNAYSVIDGDELNDFLSESNTDFYAKNGIDIKDKNWINKISVSDIFGEIIDIVKDKALKPIRVFFSLVSVILITAAFTGNEEKIGINRTAVISGVSVVSLIILSDIWGLISSLTVTVRSVCRIVLLFVPVFETALFLSGRVTTAAASSGILLAMTQGLSLIAANYVLPVMGGYLGLGIASALTPFSFIRQLGNTLKKASVTILSVIFSVFVGITGLQTTVNAAADNLTIKTTKFIVGTFVPVGGGTLSEAANTVYSSMSLIKSSIGIYAVISIALICLPVIIMTLLFKFAFSLASVIAETFSLTELAGLTAAVNSLLSVVLSIILFFSGIFVFSIALSVGLSGGG